VPAEADSPDAPHRPSPRRPPLPAPLHRPEAGAPLPLVGRLLHLVRRHPRDHPRDPARIPPFHNLGVGGRHLHHLVFGIAGLLGTGYLWLVQIGTGSGEHPDDGAFKVTAVTYGAASAITLDEFALWLNLKDVYWARQGRESVDAVVLFGAALSVGLWGGPFFRALYHEARKEWQRASGHLPEGEPAQ